jgi:hypothetical protein
VNANGSFLIDNLTPGSYEILVFASRPAQKGSRNVSAKQTVTVTGDNPVEVDILLDLSRQGSDK